MNKSCLLLTYVFWFLMITGCSLVPANEYEAKLPDDEVSEIICNHFDDNEFIYDGKSRIIAYNIIYYRYINGNLDQDSITEFALLLNSIDNLEDKKIAVNVCTPLSAGAALKVFSLSNFSDDKLDSPDYSGFYCLTIAWEVAPAKSFLYDPYTYSQISGIRKLVVSDKMQEQADEDQIDWYEIWPDLEEVVVYETDQYGNRIE